MLTSTYRSHSFPILSQLALMYLGTSASSVPVESLFSTAGLVMNGKQSSLSPDKLNKIVFIHDNFDMIVEAAAVATGRPTATVSESNECKAGPSWGP
jgi:hAT family C-terminal dimerisation region